MAVELYLIRHPRLLGASGLCYGRLDFPLAEDADQVAARLLPQLPAHFTLHSSPAGRCVALATALEAAPKAASSLPLQPDPQLAEMHFGAWEGQPWDALPRPAIDAWAADPLHFTPPGGESAAAVLARALAWVADLRVDDKAGAHVAVTHGGPIRLLLAHWRGIPPERWHEISVDFASLTAVTLPAHA